MCQGHAGGRGLSQGFGKGLLVSPDSFEGDFWDTLQDTAIRYMTDGCLLRHILADPLAKLFGLLKKLFLQEKPAGRRTDMKVVVMSATLEVEKLSEFFGHCSVLHIPGRSYPVKEIFCNLLSPRDVGSSAYVTEAVKVALDVHLNEPEGDILVFLTGQNEIERACDVLFRRAEAIDYRYEVHDRAVEGLLILPLYGSMSTGQSPKFPYLDPPEERHILEALKELYQCNAIDRRGHVTRLGEFLVQFPLPPNLSCAVIKAASLGCEDLLLPIAAMLSVENVFIRPGDPQKQKEAELQHQELASQVGGCNDFATLLNIFEQCKASKSPSAWCQKYWIHWRAVKSAFSVERQLREITTKLKQLPDFPKETFEGSRTEILRRCLCAGYFVNVARRSAARTFCTMDGHGSIVYIHPSSTLYNQETLLEWIIFHDVAVTSKIYVRTVCPVRYEWLRELLPRLHQVDAYELSSVAREEVTEEEITKWKQREELKRLFGKHSAHLSLCVCVWWLNS
nr:probable ATP-dependent RNA helicase DHX40 [Zonotrichia albicollis]